MYFCGWLIVQHYMCFFHPRTSEHLSFPVLFIWLIAKAYHRKRTPANAQRRPKKQPPLTHTVYASRLGGNLLFTNNFFLSGNAHPFADRKEATIFPPLFKLASFKVSAILPAHFAPALCLSILPPPFEHFKIVPISPFGEFSLRFFAANSWGGKSGAARKEKPDKNSSSEEALK